jgi:hypothetical protein
LNPTPGYRTAGSPAPAVEAFRRRLVALGVNVTVRDTRGRDISAACGQLVAPTPGPSAAASLPVPLERQGRSPPAGRSHP